MVPTGWADSALHVVLMYCCIVIVASCKAYGILGNIAQLELTLIHDASRLCGCSSITNPYYHCPPHYWERLFIQACLAGTCDTIWSLADSRRAKEQAQAARERRSSTMSRSSSVECRYLNILSLEAFSFSLSLSLCGIACAPPLVLRSRPSHPLLLLFASQCKLVGL